MISDPVTYPEDSTLHLPRILCLHGGGTNATIFRMQCRSLSRMLAPYFRLVYAEARLDSVAGPDVLSVYADYGPFKRWFRWLPDQAPLDDCAMVEAIDDSLQEAMDADDAKGAYGPWAGLLGFSQGAKLAASLLFRQQVRADKLGAKRAGSNWRFAVLMAGRSPIVNLDPDVFNSPLLSSPSQVDPMGTPDLMDIISGKHILRLPTIHVHGVNDAGLHLHQQLLDEYCDQDSARLVEWDGAHRVPLKAVDVRPVVDQIIDVAKQTGVM
jgi:predicted esterase